MNLRIISAQAQILAEKHATLGHMVIIKQNIQIEFKNKESGPVTGGYWEILCVQANM